MHILSFWVVADFLWDDTICQHGYFGKLVLDGGSENKKAVAELVQRYGIKTVVVLAYYSQANGITRVDISQLLMFHQKYQMVALLTGCEICRQSFGQINQMCVP